MGPAPAGGMTVPRPACARPATVPWPRIALPSRRPAGRGVGARAADRPGVAGPWREADGDPVAGRECDRSRGVALGLLVLDRGLEARGGGGGVRRVGATPSDLGTSKPRARRRIGCTRRRAAVSVGSARRPGRRPARVGRHRRRRDRGLDDDAAIASAASVRPPCRARERRNPDATMDLFATIAPSATRRAPRRRLRDPVAWHRTSPDLRTRRAP